MIVCRGELKQRIPQIFLQAAQSRMSLYLHLEGNLGNLCLRSRNLKKVEHVRSHRTFLQLGHYEGSFLSLNWGCDREFLSFVPFLVHRRDHLRIKCAGADSVHTKAKFTRDVLTPPQLEKWVEAGKYIEALGLDTEEADRILGKAFGWIQSPFWSEEVHKTVPEDITVLEILNIARGTGLTDEQLVAVLKKFPELLNCLDTIEKNVGILDKEWGITGKPLKNLIIRNPRVLGYNVDCKGDCMAKCTRCWVRF